MGKLGDICTKLGDTCANIYDSLYKTLPYIFITLSLASVTDLCFGSPVGQYLYSKGQNIVSFHKGEKEIRLGNTPQTDSKYDKTIAQGLEGTIIAFTLWDLHERRKINKENARL